ncbi:WD40 repeat-like protein [Suillus brevipes Sb2]|nr:WD40 repeat-like protein [Suillus brevipes Sb2]
MPYRKIKVNNSIGRILHLPGGQQMIICSWDGLIQVWDLETDTQVGEEWEDKDFRVETIALSPDSKKVASGSRDGAVKLWNVDTGKIIKTWTGHTKEVRSVSWSPDGGRVVSVSNDGTFRVWDVENGKTILGPINAGERVWAVCYSPDAKMIATGGIRLKIWDANSGESLTSFEEHSACLAWTSDGKTLIAGRLKIDTATWTVLDLCKDYVSPILLLSPNNRILATTPHDDKTAQLWNLETNQPIGTPLHHLDYVESATFSADGKFLVTGCRDDHIYTWDVSAIVEGAGLPSDIMADVTLRPAPKMTGARQLPPGFFDDALREANLRIRLSQSHAPPTPTPRQRGLNSFTSVWRRYKPHGATEPAAQSRSRPFSWTQILSGILRRRDRSDIQLQEVEVPCTAGKPRNYHARKKKPATSSSRPPNTHTTQQPTQQARSKQKTTPPQNKTNTKVTHSATPENTREIRTLEAPQHTRTGQRHDIQDHNSSIPNQTPEKHHQRNNISMGVVQTEIPAISTAKAHYKESRR